ncbi:VQ motif-containing protein 4 [Eucalyptus grandis]|uniref:Uncharacterized protein n=2 Tax=Eucalyptus grandis TaxID=71139 RepID=A0ACC3KDB0_EUCGR|nr:VQ motif-containing protein 4 [Eucalyptus grandis]KAK3424352.1 hypothetical protein EUGRSUZ_F01148 [Eucalyptus grandis]
MEAAIKQQERESPHPPMSSSSSCIINGHRNSASSDHHPMSSNGGAAEIPTTPHPLTPKTITRSETNPYPTTFVQADTTNFKQVVQMLTGSSETVNKQASKPPSGSTSPQDPPSLPPNNSKSAIPPKKQGFKLYERRNSLKNSLMINTLVPGFGPNSGFSPRKQEILSPSMLDFPRLALSPVTPLNEDPFYRSSPSLGSSSEEDRAIAEKGFYLHPSPINTPRDAEPQLLPLFPVTSPRVSGVSGASS